MYCTCHTHIIPLVVIRAASLPTTGHLCKRALFPKALKNLVLTQGFKGFLWGKRVWKGSSIFLDCPPIDTRWPITVQWRTHIIPLVSIRVASFHTTSKQPLFPKTLTTLVLTKGFEGFLWGQKGWERLLYNIELSTYGLTLTYDSTSHVHVVHI